MSDWYKHPPEPGYWRTKDGIVLRIADMADGHLANTIRFLERELAVDKSQDVLKCLTYPGPSGDGATMLFAQAFDEALEETSLWGDIWVPKYEELLAEKERRG